MKKEINEFIGQDLQKSVKGLISGEWQAGLAFNMMTMACDKSQRQIVRDMFSRFASDCVNIRMQSLIQWCEFYDCDMPCSESEFRKCCAPSLVKAINKIKKGQPAKYYIQLAQEIIKELASAYQAAVSKEGVCQYTDLQSILWQSFYSISDMVNTVNSVEIACDAEVEMII